MYALKFAKIDFLKAKSLIIMGLIPACAVFLSIRSIENAVFAASYCIFGGVVMASVPFQNAREHEIGFVQMLPARPGDNIRGHFLYAAGALLYGAVTGGAVTLIGYALHPRAEAAAFVLSDWGRIGLITLSLAIVITAVQSLMLSAFSFDTAKGLQILRLVPAFFFFFIVNYGSEHRGIVEAVSGFLAGPGLWLLPAAALAVFVAAMEAAVRLWDR